MGSIFMGLIGGLMGLLLLAAGVFGFGFSIYEAVTQTPLALLGLLISTFGILLGGMYLELAVEEF